MIYVEQGFTITDSSDKTPGHHDDSTSIPHLHLCGLSEGYPKYSNLDGHRHTAGSPYQGFVGIDEVRMATIDEHKTLFSLVYGHSVHLSEEGTREFMLRIVNVMALAEYYEILPAIVSQITDLVIDQPGIWEEVAAFPVMYLAVGKKLRSSEIFADALRHFIGSGSSLSLATDNGVLSTEEACVAIFPAKEHLEGRIRRTIETICGSTLSTYQAHATQSWSRRGPCIKTTWLAAGFEKKDTADKCRWLAGSIVREWLDRQLVGEAHWSHTKHALTEPKNGDVEAGSARKIFEIIIEAADAEKPNLELIGHDLAKRYSNIFYLEREKYGKYHPAGMITRDLRYLVRSACDTIRWEFRGLLGPQACGCEHAWVEDWTEEGHEHAHHDRGLKYFTCMSVTEEVMPWRNKMAWKEVVLPAVDLQDATVAWLRAVGV